MLFELALLEILMAFICVWIVVAPWNPNTLVASVVVIEFSPYLFVVNATVLGCVARAPRTGLWLLFVTVAIANLCVSAIPGLALLTPEKSRAVARVLGVLGMHAWNPLREIDIPVDLGGLPAHMHAYLPRLATPAPIIFSIYGGSWRHGGPGNDARLNRALATQGYAVFALDYRHAPQYRFPAALNDVKSQIRFVEQSAAKYNVDPTRVAIIGHSSGGELALLSAYQPGSQVRAVVSYSGAIDLEKAYLFPPPPDPVDVRAILRDYLGGPPAAARAAYRAASPLNSVRKDLPATLLIYGARDHVVDFRSALELRDALAADNNHVTLLRLPWAEHGFEMAFFGLHAQYALGEVEEFLERALGRLDSRSPHWPT